MDLFSCIAAVENHSSPVFAPLLPRLCAAPFVFASVSSSLVSPGSLQQRFYMNNYQESFPWKRIWVCLCGLTGPSVWSVLRSLLFASTFMFSKVSSLECTAVSFACTLSKRTGCSLAGSLSHCPHTHIHTFSYTSKCVHRAEWMAASEQRNI